MALTKSLQRRAVFGFGISFIVIMLVIALGVPNPTDFQIFVFRIVLALAAAGVAAMIPGFINVEVSSTIKAGGAIAIFVIIYFFNPAKFVTTSINNNSADLRVADLLTKFNITSIKENSADLRIADLLTENPYSRHPKVIIKLFNAGGKTAFLTRISANVLLREPLASLVRPSAKYDLLIASDRNEIYVAHEIKPNEVDMIVLKLGATEYNMACKFRLQLELTYNEDQKLLSEPFEVGFYKQ